MTVIGQSIDRTIRPVMLFRDPGKQLRALRHVTIMHMANRLHQMDTKCFRCGECCRRYQVLLDHGEETRLAEYLDLSPESFRMQYADTRWPSADKCLVRHVDGGCPFLRIKERDHLCTVHSVKPQPCRDWAADLAKPECIRGLKEVWGLSVDDAGHLNGTPEDIHTFQVFLNACT